MLTDVSVFLPMDFYQSLKAVRVEQCGPDGGENGMDMEDILEENKCGKRAS